MTENDKLKGTAGEHLAIFDANINDYSCSLTSEESEYDLVLDTGKSLLKVQVKSSTHSRSKTKNSLSFTISRRNSDITRYNVDLFAFVNLEGRKVAWISVCNLGKHRKSIKKSEFSSLTLDKVLAEIELAEIRKSNEENKMKSKKVKKLSKKTSNTANQRNKRLEKIEKRKDKEN